MKKIEKNTLQNYGINLQLSKGVNDNESKTVKEGKWDKGI